MVFITERCCHDYHEWLLLSWLPLHSVVVIITITARCCHGYHYRALLLWFPSQSVVVMTTITYWCCHNYYNRALLSWLASQSVVVMTTISWHGCHCYHNRASLSQLPFQSVVVMTTNTERCFRVEQTSKLACCFKNRTTRTTDSSFQKCLARLAGPRIHGLSLEKYPQKNLISISQFIVFK